MKPVEELVDSFFVKKSCKKKSQTLAHYKDYCEAGGLNGNFYTHICYNTMKEALIKLSELERDFYTIVETGCASHGTKSTLLWDKFVNMYNGQVFSVDLNQDSVNKTNNLTSNKTNVTCSDSLKYLPKLTDKIDFLYLDSYDVDFLNPKDSAEHHLKEFNCIKHLLHKNSIILIDDTPLTPEWLDNGKSNKLYEKIRKNFNPSFCGKGSLVNIELEKMGAKKILHQYQVLWII